MNLTHSKLCEVAVKWLRKVKKQNCKYHTYPITGSEIACYNGVKWIETPDAIGFNAYSSCVIECKMSRSDFFADQKKPFRTDGNGMGQKRFFLCPENLINENELPHGWGLLYVDDKMKVKEVKDSDTFDMNVEGLKAERQALVSIAKGLKNKKESRQMSELKAFNMPQYAGAFTMHEVYLKSEADKVIAEKDKTISEMKKACYSKDEWCLHTLKENRHQKYRRCLAMARRCHNESLWWYSQGYGFEKYDKFWEKWEKRWLELAEKFKEAK